MTADIYYRIEHKDGRRENYHLYAFTDEGIDELLDVMNQIKKTGKLTLYQISRKEFLLSETDKKGPIDIHKDLYKPNDAEGEKIGYFEYYQL